ncbi:unnamed protein product [Malus baccata var. baccata]
MYIKCPHANIDSDTQMNIFFDGLNPTSKSHVNASTGGSLSNKSAREVFELFYMMATESQQWAAEHSQKRGIFELSAGSPNMSAQIEKMEKKMDAKFDIILQQIANSTQQPPTPTVYSICRMAKHDIMGCLHKESYPELVKQHVNMMNSYIKPRNDAYATHYNIGWRDHLNFKSGDNQNNAKPFQNTQKPFIPSKPSLEDQLAKLVATTQSFIDGSNQRIQNVEASIKSLENNSGKHNLTESNIPSVQTPEHVYEPPTLYPERLILKAKDQLLKDFMQTLAKVHINLPLKIVLTEQCIAVLLHELPPKKKDPGSFTISCTIGNCEGELKPTSNIIQLANHSITYPRGVIEDVIVKVDNLFCV